MKLKDYFFGLERSQRSDFAERCGTSVDYLMQLCYSHRRPKVELAVRIARESGNTVTCEELLPDVDWHFVRSSGQVAA
jgi:DNA-binding transcriptional regulator YdaS (Cro superfamily)